MPIDRRHLRTSAAACVSLGLVLLAATAGAAEEVVHDEFHLDGASLSLLWGLPFAGMLLSIAILPLAAPHFWEHNFGKVSAFWILTVIVPDLIFFGWQLTLFEIVHLLFLEYLPFIILLLSLFTVAGGIHIAGSFRGTPVSNTAFLAAGTALASWTGTTGASMLLIRPVLRANAGRRYQVHVIIFFIFLVSNIGGSLTPLGDPPLFLGFLKGISFFWPTVHLFLPMLMVAAILLALFFALDSYLLKREGGLPPATGVQTKVSLQGWANVGLLLCIVGAVLLSGTWKPGISFFIFHVEIHLENVVRDLLLLLIAWVSWKYTDREHRRANAFNWHPIVEVAKLFAGIFVTIVPVIEILRAGTDGALASVLRAVTSETGTPIDSMYFWLTGMLSSFLDNAPTYLVFFNAAGGNVEELMGPLASTLLAISAGAVFMGANSYIGNAPNFMVKSIAESQGIRMPSFFGYLAWSGLILLPLFVLLTLVFF